jgi:hypothetical protein
MRATNRAVVVAAALAAGSCGLLGGHGSLPGGSSGEVDPNTCGNYAASDAGAKLKVFLEATKNLQTTTTETVKVVKQSCILMGNELGMPGDQLSGDDTDKICKAVISTYQNNLKANLKAGAKLNIQYTPGKCTVDASASASASGGCSGDASAGAGGGGASGQCAAAAQVNASVNAQCTPPQLTIAFDAGVAVDATKLQMTVKALQDGLPKLLDVAARIKPIQDALAGWVQSAGDLAAMGPKFAQSFGDQAMCIAGQLTAVAKAKTQVSANVSVSVSVSASASATAGGG